MTISNPQAQQEAREIGSDSNELQKDVAIAMSRFLNSLYEQLRRNKHIQQGSVPTVSIALGDKQYTEKTLRSGGSDIAKDVDYIEKAMQTPASEQSYSHFNRNLSVSVDGKDVLVVKNGVVLKNDICLRLRAEKQASSTPAKESSSRPPQPTSGSVTESPAHVVEAELVQDPVETKEAPSSSSTAENTPSQSHASPVIFILTREIQNRTPLDRGRDRVLVFARQLAQVPNRIALKLQSDFATARDRVVRHLNDPRTPERKDLQQLSVLSVAHELLNRYGQTNGGKDVFEGNLYRIERSPRESLTIFAKDGRGTIFEQQSGSIAENLTSFDRGRFANIQSRMALQHGQDAQRTHDLER